jgi:hypothetical protein
LNRKRNISSPVLEFSWQHVAVVVKILAFYQQKGIVGVVGLHTTIMEDV